MLKRNFHLKLSSTYEGKDNKISSLDVKVYSNHKWETFKPDILSPGFLLLVYALFSCQHRYMRMNCAERDIVLDSASGELKLVAGEDWDVKSVYVCFNAVVKNGSPGPDDINYIQGRMKHCPVSSNLPSSASMENKVKFEHAS